MSDNSGNGVFVLHSVSGCYAEVHISYLIYPIQIVTSLLYQSFNSALVGGYAVYLQERSLAYIALEEG